MSFKKIINAIFQRSTVKDAAIVGIVVGTILNIVNQGELFLKFNFEDISYLKLILTYSVPYLVSTYSSVKTRFSLNLEEKCKKIH